MQTVDGKACEKLKIENGKLKMNLPLGMTLSPLALSSPGVRAK